MLWRVADGPRRQRCSNINQSGNPEQKHRFQRRPDNATRKGGIDAAEYLFSKHGLNGVTLRDVALKVGVHTSLMHYYFVDKRRLFEAVFARRAGTTDDDGVTADDAKELADRGILLEDARDGRILWKRK